MPITGGVEAWVQGWIALTLTKILIWTCLYCLKCAKFCQLILRIII